MGHRMDNIAKILVERLFNDQNDATRFHSYIRTMLETMTVNPVESCQELNRRMQLQGWVDYEIDEHTFKLVMLVLNDI